MRVLFLSIILSALSMSLFGQSKDMRRGDQLFEQARYKDALKYYLLAFESMSNDPQLNLRIAQCYVKQLDGKNAATYISTCLGNTKVVTNEMHYCNARSLHLNLKFDEAKKAYQLSDPYRANHKDISKKLKECDFGKKMVKAPIQCKIKNMGEDINTKYRELLPKITADFQKMIFTSHRPGATGKLGNPEDVYMSVIDGGKWSRPFQLLPPINTDDNDACIGLSPDGQTMFLFRGSNGGDIWMSELKGDKWTKPTPMPFNTPEKETSVTISPDGRTLLFTRRIGKGDANIYQCRKTSSGKWSKPIKLGARINTPYDEESPFLHPDGKTLYFSSKGHSSMGGYDIMKSSLVNGAWSTPVNLGYPINTAADDLCFVLSASGQFGFYSSQREEGYGDQDIYMISMPVPKRKPSLALLKGTVKDAFSEKPVEANITVTDNEANKVVAEFKSNGKTGEYLVSLPAGKNYGVTIEKEGHLFHSENVYLAEGSGYKSIKKEIKLVNAKPGSSIVLNNIFFESGKYALTPQSNAELQKMVGILNKYKELKVEISGHTDNSGNADLNVTLSENRAKAVVNYLVDRGISKSRLTAKGYGSSQPIASNKTPQGRKQNRRTEFKIL